MQGRTTRDLMPRLRPGPPERWPDMEMLKDLPIAENWKDAGQMRRKVSQVAFATRAQAARGHRHSWTLSSTLTNLYVDKNGEVAHVRSILQAPERSSGCIIG